MIRILVTRPEPDADETAGRLIALGLEPSVFPLMRMQTTEARLPAPEGLSGLIVTSANALRALHRRDALGPYFGLRVFAVGERTAAVAKGLGFADIVSANGDAGDLIGLVADHAEAGSYFYPSAEETAHELPKTLAASGHEIIAAEIYRMVPQTRLSDEIAGQLAAGGFAAALFYSRRTAHIFARLTEPVLTPERRRALTPICLSENVAAPLVEHGFPRIVLADFPSEEAMMAATLSFSRGQITP